MSVIYSVLDALGKFLMYSGFMLGAFPSLFISDIIQGIKEGYKESEKELL